MTADRSVRATFAKTAPHCVVPNVLGKSVGGAVPRLVRAHCSPGRVTKVASSPSKKGKVLSERPRAGVVRANGAKVDLMVGKGPARRKFGGWVSP